MAGKKWTMPEATLALKLYCQLPFGQMHKSNEQIIDLAKRLGRTPSAVAMKLSNFASLDPIHQRRNIKGLQNVSEMDRELFQQYSAGWEKLIEDSLEAERKLFIESKTATAETQSSENGPEETEKLRLTKSRLVQSFFRDTVLASYNFECSICGLNIPELLIASHIIPWNKEHNRRADPTNGIALCALHDKAFDRGFLSISDDYKVMISRALGVVPKKSLAYYAFELYNDSNITLPHRFIPDLEALNYHRSHIFRS